MVQDVLIRSARLEDVESLARLMTQLGYPTTPAAMHTRLEALLEHPGYQTFVAEEHGVVVGMAGACVGFAYEKDGIYGRLLALVVDADRRDRGIGEKLAEAAERWLRSQGAQAIMVTSRRERARAHRFYERLGYQITGLRLVKELK